MARFEISNKASGHIFGVYDGETELNAYRAMMRDAGYDEAGDEIPDEIDVRPIEDVVREFARLSAENDYRVVSEDDELTMTDEWSGEHTTALAGRLQMDVSELGDELIDIAQAAYRRAAHQLMRAE